MFEKVNPSHPDKIADRIAGAIVDLAYAKEDDPKVAVEVLIGHGQCYIIAETSVEDITKQEVESIVHRIAENDIAVTFVHVPQDIHLADNQAGKIRCGDNGIFKGVPVTEEQKCLSAFAKILYEDFRSDGKFILDNNRCIVCQSNDNGDLKSWTKITKFVTVNPLGEWSGGTNVDSGATNRKLGSDMGDSVTGGGLHGKDLSKADVSVNIYAWLKAQELNQEVNLCCAIGDAFIDGKPYSGIVEIARKFIQSKGGFEKFAEWGLI